MYSSGSSPLLLHMIPFLPTNIKEGIPSTLYFFDKSEYLSTSMATIETFLIFREIFFRIVSKNLQGMHHLA